MLWSAGIAVTVNGQNLVNPNPARIINMSLGGSGACPASYQDAINQILAKGVVVVASAGNETGAVNAPANCAGVIAVAGVREDGTKVGYSSFGSQVAVSAPAGNCVNTGAQQPCLYTITTTTNLGVTEPGRERLHRRVLLLSRQHRRQRTGQLSELQHRCQPIPYQQRRYQFLGADGRRASRRSWRQSTAI